MNKTKTIAAIIDESKIHHNISTLGMKLPEAPEGMPDDIFWNACQNCIDVFIEDWMYNPRNDSGNRNLCGCAQKVICKPEDFKKDNGYDGRAYIDLYHRWMDESEAKKLGIINKQVPGITLDGACKEHDLYHVYSHGRSGATLYWDKYWKSTNSGFYFLLDEEDLKEKEDWELKEILEDLQAYNQGIEAMMKSLPEELKHQYKDWTDQKEEDARHEALGYNKTLEELLESKNELIRRHAKGILSALQK